MKGAKEPCSAGCQSHVSHPCEKCGLQWGKEPTAKERLAELIWQHRIDSDTGQRCADDILKEFVRREDVEVCRCVYGLHEEECDKCNGLGWVAKGD